MKQRCYNKNHKSYNYYGGKGIAVCEKWRRDFKAFYEWSIHNGYELGLTIDRVNNREGYDESNCRWATWSEQANNRNPRGSK